MKKRAVSDKVSATPEENTIEVLSSLCDELYRQTDRLDHAAAKLWEDTEAQEAAAYYRDSVLPVMARLRDIADQIELRLAAEYQPYPTYADLLFSI